jgi:hypothetical protein
LRLRMTKIIVIGGDMITQRFAALADHADDGERRAYDPAPRRGALWGVCSRSRVVCLHLLALLPPPSVTA